MQREDEVRRTWSGKRGPIASLIAVMCGVGLSSGEPPDQRERDKPRYTTELETSAGRVVQKPLLLDPKAVSTDPEKAPFVAPPPGSKPYYAFPVIEATCKAGWCYGAITDFLSPDDPRGCTIGDGFVQAPDGTRAGVLWELGESPTYNVISEADGQRWGVYHFIVAEPVTDVESMSRVFHRMLPKLRETCADQEALRLVI